ALVLTIGGAWVGSASTVAAETEVATVNRVFISLTTFLITMLGHLWIASRRRLEEQTSTLKARNADLDSVNQELGQREEEIVRQNEELQSQTEELERQSEELRVTNDELVAWQRILEQLLELSRSMKPEQGLDEVYRKICEALGLLTNGFAASVLEKKGDDLVVRCHLGFGPEGVVSATLPFSETFAALIMSLGQTGYLEDVSLRPELRFPAPNKGLEPRAVLSTPLRLHGSCIGVIEVYAPTPQSWSEMNVATIEAFTAQAAACLQTAELLDALCQERRRFESAFHTVPFGVAVADDPAGREIRINPAAAAMLNLPVSENVTPSAPMGTRLKRAIYRGDKLLRDDEWPIVRALGGVETHGDELDLLLPAGRRLTLLVSASPILDANCKVAGAVAGFIDITAVKLLQRELETRRREAEEASVRKTRFLAAVSHDIRTPANAINLMAEVIRRNAGNPAMASQIPELAQKLQANTESMMELVSDLLDVARFDSGKIEMLDTEFSLGGLMEDECRQLLPLAQDKGLRLLVEPMEHPILLRADRVKLGRVIGNLIGNAIKFTEAGEIKVGAGIVQEPERRIVLRIVDTGIGIPAEHLPHIFDEFGQFRNPERDRRKGTGLGLAISKRIIDVMGGVIEVESSVGRGTKFTVSLPASMAIFRLDVAHAPFESSEGYGSPAGTPLRLRVLLVEDHETTREGTKQILADEGITVIEAAGAREALSLMETEQIDVLLLDMMLPDMDGREVLRAIGKGPRKLKGVLVLTGDLTQDRLDEIQRLGADGVIEKPVDVKKLVQTLRSYDGK
ncbi:MAG TPA: ATP-binding protein, partial [Planctomycetota bacterium]|nr:ATP-binding protein [Planctomycetota bacterium]